MSCKGKKEKEMAREKNKTFLTGVQLTNTTSCFDDDIIQQNANLKNYYKTIISDTSWAGDLLFIYSLQVSHETYVYNSF